MTEEDFVYCYEQIAEELTTTGRGWIVSQVEERLNQGKTHMVKVETLKLRDETAQLSLFSEKEHGLQFQRGKSAEFLQLADYTVQERLFLLLDAIEVLVIHEMSLEDAVLTFFQDSAHVQSIELYSEQENRTVALFQYGDSRQKDVEMLASVVRKFRKEATL
jgi:hypothetical protein